MLFRRQIYLLSWMVLFAFGLDQQQQIKELRTEFFNNTDPYLLLENANDLPQNSIFKNFSFAGTSLIVNDTAEFILVRPNDFEKPFLEICGPIDANCKEDSFICYSSDSINIGYSGCPKEQQYIRMKEGLLSSGAKVMNLNIIGSTCSNYYEFYVDESLTWLTTISNAKSTDAISYEPIKKQPLPNSGEKIQIKMKVVKNYCGVSFRFPYGSIGIDNLPPPTTIAPSTTTTSTKKPTITTESSDGLAKTTVTAETSNVPVMGIVLGTIALLIVIIVVAALVIRYVIKRRRKKSYPIQPKSVNSLALPPPPLLSNEPLVPVFLDPLLEDKTQEESVRNQLAPRTQPTQSSIVANEKKKLSADVQTAIPKPISHISKERVSKERVAPGAVVPMSDKETQSSEVPLPDLTIDTSKKCTKIFKHEFDRGVEDSIQSEESCGENIYKLEPYACQSFPLPDKTMSSWPPDYVECMAVRAPTIEQRGIWHHQAVIMANNLLYKKGIRNNKGVLTGPDKAMRWLKNRQNIPFIQFIAESIENAPDGNGPEFLASKVQWRRYLKKIDLMETYRQSCWIGQTKERRQFFLLATFYKMEHLVKQFPAEDDLKSFPFPIPMLLEVRKEAPHFFEVEDGVPPHAQKKTTSEQIQKPQIPKFS